MCFENKSMIYWHCHRGMRELDLIFITFFKNEYEFLTKEEKKNFVDLLSYQDYELFSWLMDQESPRDDNLFKLIKLIQYKYETFNFIEF